MLIKQFAVFILMLLVGLPSHPVYARSYLSFVVPIVGGQPNGPGSCPVFAAPIVSGQINDARWAGVSGLSASRTNVGAWWIHNDGGAGITEAGVFYAITVAGDLLGKWTLAGVSQWEQDVLRTVDVEDIAVGPGPSAGIYLYLGDIGGNRYTPFGRSTIRIARLPEPRVDVRAGTQPDAVVTDYSILTFAYPNGERYDAETLMVDTNGDIYVVTKDSKEGKSQIFYVPSLPQGQNTATMIQVATLQFGTGALPGNLSATAGDMSSNGSEAIIRTYNRVFLWQKDENFSWAKTFAESTPCILPSASSHQYEAIAFAQNGIDVYDTYETANGNATIQRYGRYTTSMYIPLIER
jgi:hypothetical protein